MKKKYDISAFPDAMRDLPYCCWRLEKTSSRRQTKIPYNPKTGERAKADTLSTFGTLEEAIAAYRKGRYTGIGMDVHIGGTVGCIDLDACVDDDGVISENAQKVVAMLPDAHVEYSPSHTGLHLFFVIPEGFVFDSDLYYVNSRKKKMEIYLPTATNHFMTVTGDVLHTGEMVVSADELYAFLDAFMQRPTMEVAKIDPPAGGSVLTDGEVLQKLAADPNGERFMKIYRGDWEECRPEDYKDDENWTHSEADLALCRKLAFYCRGDMEQMDRLYRESGMMRDKWDRQIGGTSYAMITMTNAIKGCTAFYEPPESSSAEEDFEAVDYASILDRLLENPLTIDAVTSESALTAAAWAREHDPTRYYKLRAAIPKSIGLKNFEQDVKRYSALLPREHTEVPKAKPRILSLKGISTPGMVVPKGFLVNEKGVFYGYDEEDLGMCISPEPLFISGKIVNVDDGTEKLEITFRRNGRYKTLIAPRADMMNKNTIIQYANEGLFASSATAGYLTQYIAGLEAANNHAIPVKRCIRRAGWIGNEEFFPYCLSAPMQAMEENDNSERFLEHLHTEGSRELWLNMAAKVRTMPFARSMLAASFASPLLYPLQHRNIYYHAWCDTKSGKTAALKFAMSVWGDPAALTKSYYATMVGMEHRAGTMKHLPLALDELQTIEKKLSINNMVYTLGNGIGKTRGRAGGGIRAMDDWRNCILSTGEQPISSDNSMDGVNTRLLEVYGKPVNDVQLGAEMHQVSERNYGFAAEPYIRYVMEHMDDLKTDFEAIRSSLDMLYGDANVNADNIAVLALADYYSSICVFGMEKEAAWSEATEMGAALMGVQKLEDHTDTVDRAWNFVTGWVAGNKKKFTEGIYEPPEIYGIVEDGKVSVISGALNKALEEAGYSYRKCIRGFGEREYLKTFPDSNGKTRTQILKRVKGVPTRVYVLNLEIAKEAEPEADEEEALPF